MLTPCPTDEDLLARYRSGDAAAFDLLYDRHARRLHAYVLGLTRDWAAAQDVVQESFVRLLDRGAPEAVAVFLYAVARNRVIDDARRSAVRRSAEGALSRLLAGRERRPDASWPLLEDLAGLPPEQREVLLLKVFGEFTFAEIAGLLDIPLSTAATRHQAALEKLDRLWRDA